MKGRKHSPEQIVRKLREADRLVGEGNGAVDVAKALEISTRRLASTLAEIGDEWPAAWPVRLLEAAAKRLATGGWRRGAPPRARASSVS
ncbi:MAG: hypothetical protein ACREOL_02700 [Candidatus Dormibacteria bacterium]